MGTPIEVIQTFQLEELKGGKYLEKMDQILQFFPKVEGYEDMYRLKTKIEVKNPSDEFFYVVFSDNTANISVSCLYSYLTAYLVAVGVGSELYVLDEGELNLSQELLDGKNLKNTNIGLSYRHIPICTNFNIYRMKSALACFSKGYVEKNIDWWRDSVSSIVAFTSESLRFRDLKLIMSRCCENEYEYEIFPFYVVKLMTNWGVVSKRIHMEDDWDGYPLEQLIAMVSLLTNKDGRGRSHTSRFDMGGLPTLGQSGWKNVGGRSSSPLQRPAQSQCQLGSFIPKRIPLFGILTTGPRDNKDMGRALSILPSGSGMFSPR